MTLRSSSVLVVLSMASFAAASVGCWQPRDTTDERAPITTTQASQALEAVAEGNEAADLLTASTEISTHFTLGQAVAAAATELRTFVTSQLPCAEVTLDERTLHVRYGAKPGLCTYRGQTFSGEHTMTLVRLDAGGAEVQHVWTDFSNGTVRLDGEALVTWNAGGAAFRAVEDYRWQRLADGRSFTAEADQTLGGLGGDWSTGVSWHGSRRWNGDRGSLETTIENVEARWVDPVPQAGSMTVTGLPQGAASLGFQRLDGDTIRVTIEGGGGRVSVDVSHAGRTEPVDDAS